MAIGIKVCKVCGREYETCHTLRPNLNGEFRWRDVACCEEHGAEYLRQILISRGELQEEPVVEEAPAAAEQTAEEMQKEDGRKPQKRKKKADPVADKEMA